MEVFVVTYGSVAGQHYVCALAEREISEIEVVSVSGEEGPIRNRQVL